MATDDKDLMLDVLIARPIARARDCMARRLANTGISPNWLTLLGTLLQIYVGWLFYQGHWTAGGLLLLFSASFDMLDGAVAKVSGRATRFGAFFDSTMDRISDMALFAGIIAHYGQAGRPLFAALAFYCLACAVLISYIKARAENLISDCTVGLAQRPERIVLLITASVFDCMPTGLGFIAFYSTLTTVQRILHTYWTSEGNLTAPQGWTRIAFLDLGRNSLPYDLLVTLTLCVLVVKGLWG